MRSGQTINPRAVKTFHPRRGALIYLIVGRGLGNLGSSDIADRKALN